MQNQQPYYSPAASPAEDLPSSSPTSPMASGCSESCYDSSRPSTPGHLSNFDLLMFYDIEPTAEITLGNLSHQDPEACHSFANEEYDEFRAPTPKCVDHQCVDHRNDQAGYFFRDPIPNIHGPVPSEPSTFTLNDEQAALQFFGSSITNTSQGDSTPCLDNGLKFANPLVDLYASFSSLPEQVEMDFLQVDMLADNAFLFAGVANQNQGDWDCRHADPMNLFQLVEPAQQEVQEPEPTVISALRSFIGQFITHDTIFSAGMPLRLMDCWALKCLKEVVSLWATGPQSAPLLSFLCDFSRHQGWLEERIWSNKDAGIGELTGLILSERGRKELVRIWQWVSTNVDQLQASGLDVPSAEELSVRFGRLEYPPNEYSLASVRLGRNTNVAQVCYDDPEDL